MIVVEYSTDDYGKVMKYISCIKEKAEELEEMLEEHTFNQRKPYMRYDDEDSPRKKSRYDSFRYV